MTDDEILEALGRTACKHDPAEDMRLDSIAAGTASASERAELEKLAAESSAYREALAAVRPFGAATRARFAERVIARLEAQGVAMRQDPTKTETAAEAAAPSSQMERARARSDTPAWAAERRSLILQRRVFAGVAAASLAAMLYVLSGGTHRALQDGHEPPANLPAIELVVVGGDQMLRAAPGAPHADAPPSAPPGTDSIAPGSRLELVLRPAVRVGGTLAIRGFVRRAGSGEPLRAWVPPIERAPGQAVRIAGTREALFGGAAGGLYEVVLVVGRDDATVETAARAVEHGASGSDDAGRWQMFRHLVFLSPPPGP